MVHPDTPRPEPIDPQVTQVVNQPAGPQPPQWPSHGYPQMVVKPRRRWGRWIALISVVVALACAGATGLGIALVRLDREPDVVAQSSATKPAKDEPPALRKVREVLAEQSEALLAGDEAGYLSVLDSKGDPQERKALARQFRSLRAMKVASWRDEVELTYEGANADGNWDVTVKSYFCFVAAPCGDAVAYADTAWRVGQTATLVDWEPVEPHHPWQISELVAKAGERTIVATTREHASKLASVLREAEKAAVVADRFAQDDPPTRYVIYYAGEDEWTKWFSWQPSRWVAGAAINVSDDRYAVVLNGRFIGPKGIAGVLRHELTHAASLAGKFGASWDYWWLREGIAEFAEADGAPIRHHPGLPYAAEVLAESTDGFEVEPPGGGAEDAQVSGAYTIAFLAVRCLAERFGERRFVDFFHAVIHDRLSYKEASSDVFGMPWQSLSNDCLQYVKSAI